MLKDDWGNRIALGVAYLALLVIVFGASYGLIINGYAELHKAYATYQATAERDRDAAADKIESTCFNADRAKFLECFRNEIKTYYEKQAANQDLQAQQDMGFWAAALFILGIGQAALSAIGIIFIWRSLALNRDAVNAAIESNRLTREIGHADVGAYLECLSGEYIIDHRQADISITLENKGGSSSRFTTITSVTTYFFKIGEMNFGFPILEDRVLPAKEATCESIAKGKTETVRIAVIQAHETGLKEFADLFNMECAFEVRSQIVWRDVFKLDHTIDLQLVRGPIKGTSQMGDKVTHVGPMNIYFQTYKGSKEAAKD